MGKKRYILFAVLGLLLVVLMTAALTINGDSFKRLSATDAVRWMDSEGILPVSSYQTSAQLLDYDLVHVVYDNLSLRFANTSFRDAETMPAWPEELADKTWSDTVSGADFILAMDRIPTGSLTAETASLRDEISAAEDVTVTVAAEYIYGIFHNSVVNYSVVSSLDQLDAYVGSILDSQYFLCQFLFDGPNSDEMIINAVKAAMLERGVPGITWSVRDMGSEGREFSITFEY